MVLPKKIDLDNFIGYVIKCRLFLFEKKFEIDVFLEEKYVVEKTRLNSYQSC